RLGSEMSSASIRAMYPPPLAFSPATSASTIPVPGPWTTRTRGSSYDARICGVASVDASSTAMSSKSSYDCARMLSTAARKKRSPSRPGMTTETPGRVIAPSVADGLGPDLPPDAPQLGDPQAGRLEFGAQRLLVVFDLVLRVAQMANSQVATQRDRPVPLLG